LSIGDVFKRFGEEVRKIINFDRITLNLVDLDRGVYFAPYSTGTALPVILPDKVMPLEGSPAEEVVKTLRPLLLNPTEGSDVLDKNPGIIEEFSIGLRSFMFVPLVFNDEIIGVLHFRSMTLDEYGTKQVDLAEHVAAQIAGAITNSVLHAAQAETEGALQKAHDDLERQVEQRTAELVATNEQLRDEIEVRSLAEGQLRSANADLIGAQSMIRSANEFTDTILLNLPVGVAILAAPDFRYVKINNTLAQLNQRSVEDHIGRTLAEIIPDAAINILPRMKQVVETGKTYPSTEFSAKMIPGSDTRNWFLDSFFPLFDEHGNVNPGCPRWAKSWVANPMSIVKIMPNIRALFALVNYNTRMNKGFCF
jgi:hypothetical protein